MTSRFGSHSTPNKRQQTEMPPLAPTCRMPTSLSTPEDHTAIPCQSRTIQQWRGLCFVSFCRS
eukprot:3805633-Amphidinium_carterae.2